MRDPFWTNIARRMQSDLRKFQLLDELELHQVSSADIHAIFATVRTCSLAGKPVHKDLLHWLKFMEQCPRSFDAIVNTMIQDFAQPVFRRGSPVSHSISLRNR